MIRHATLLSVALAATLVSACDRSKLEAPRVTLGNLERNQPKPSATEVSLIAGDVGGCGAARVEHVTVNETDADVVVAAQLRVEDPVGPCEIRTVSDEFSISLDRPLGTRRIIDDSRGNANVIWSHRVQAGARRASALTDRDAEAFLLSKRDGSGAKCIRRNFRFFECSYDRADTGRRSIVFLTVFPTGDLALGPK